MQRIPIGTILLLTLVPSFTFGIVEIQGSDTSITTLIESVETHQEITSQALTDVAPLLLRNGVFSLLASSDESLKPNNANIAGVIGHDAEKFILDGVIAVSEPRGDYPVDLFQFWSIDRNFDWMTHPRVQPLHFIRNFRVSEQFATESNLLSSAYHTCVIAKNSILRVTKKAAVHWQSGEFDKAYFFLGHALHTIQDSFAEAHTVRTDARFNNDLRDVCYYHPKKVPLNPDVKVCRHGKLTEVESSPHFPDKHPLARGATAKFLYLIANYLTQIDQAEISDRTQTVLTERIRADFFGGNQSILKYSEIMPRGVIRCHNLPRDTVLMVEKPAPRRERPSH